MHGVSASFLWLWHAAQESAFFVPKILAKKNFHTVFLGSYKLRTSTAGRLGIGSFDAHLIKLPEQICAETGASESAVMNARAKDLFTFFCFLFAPKFLPLIVRCQPPQAGYILELSIVGGFFPLFWDRGRALYSFAPSNLAVFSLAPTIEPARAPACPASANSLIYSHTCRGRSDGLTVTFMQGKEEIHAMRSDWEGDQLSTPPRGSTA